MALPNAIAGAVSVNPEAAGAASGVTGCLQMGWGAVISQLIAYPMAAGAGAGALSWAMVAQAVVGVAAFWLLVRPGRKAASGG
jgi:DHA1 family bicyclomycin/chloramphenicol resistance-like MFS transporter